MSTLTHPTDTVTGTYAVDPAHSRIGFVARHAMITKVRGSFNDIAGHGYFDAADPTRSSLELVIQAASIDTRNADRDAHLRSNQFFAMDEFPEIRFTSTAVEPVAESTYNVTGDLSIKGITKPVTFAVEYTGHAVDPFQNERIGLEGSVVVNRKDWGIDFDAPLDTGGLLVGEKVTLEFEVSAIRQPS